MRLDLFLVEQNITSSRRRAQDMITAGKIAVGGKVVSKASYKVQENDHIDVLEEDHPYVSRSALKLKGLLDEVSLSFEGENVVDVGSSTGGFTQVALEYGAEHVYAVDVGTDQLHYSLHNEERVTSMEQTDARDLLPSMFSKGEPKILVSDVSFIAVSKILPDVVNVLSKLEKMCILVKPQFELKKELIGKGGIVKSETDRQLALSRVEKVIENLGFKIQHEMDAAIAGQDGNQEYMLYAIR